MRSTKRPLRVSNPGAFCSSIRFQPLVRKQLEQLLERPSRSLFNGGEGPAWPARIYKQEILTT